jgi:hypothetical protein
MKRIKGIEGEGEEVVKNVNVGNRGSGRREGRKMTL